jgi:uncharacterized protein YozE (UPF0346 family)
MAISFSSAQIKLFKREATKLVRELFIPRHQALNQIASRHSFANWSLLVKHSEDGNKAKESAPPARTILPPVGKRYYVHGDQDEESPTAYYCSKCDVFYEPAHFADAKAHSGMSHGERYFSSLKIWKSHVERSKGNWRRAENAVNILAAHAEAELAAFEASRSKFHLWLISQKDRDDPVGDLAEDVRRDKKFPVSAYTLRELETYLSRHGDGVKQAVRQAWREFRAENRVP